MRWRTHILVAIPAEAVISGTVRAFSDSIRAQVKKRMTEIANGIAAAFEVEVKVDVRDVFLVLENHPEQTERSCRRGARDRRGRKCLDQSGARDGIGGLRRTCLRAVPGAYCWVGHSGDKPLHNPEYTFDDAIDPVQEPA